MVEVTGHRVLGMPDTGTFCCSKPADDSLKAAGIEKLLLEALREFPVHDESAVPGRTGVSRVADYGAGCGAIDAGRMPYLAPLPRSRVMLFGI